MLLCRALTGQSLAYSCQLQRTLIRLLACAGREGTRGEAGVDMWRPKAEWVVFADEKALLPVYVVKY